MLITFFKVKEYLADPSKFASAAPAASEAAPAAAATKEEEKPKDDEESEEDMVSFLQRTFDTNGYSSVLSRALGCSIKRTVMIMVMATC